MEVDRKGNVTQYRSGHYYLTHVEWDDGHSEMEIHECIPNLVWHSCDPNQLDDAKEAVKCMTHDPQTLTDKARQIVASHTPAPLLIRVPRANKLNNA